MLQQTRRDARNEPATHRIGDLHEDDPFRRQERDFLPRRLRSEIGRLPLPETQTSERRIGKARRWLVSFVSVTQQFNTTTSMGRLTLNVLLSFAQFEREVTAERIRDKVAASAPLIVDL